MNTVKILHLTDLHILARAGDTMLGIDTEYYFRRTLDQAHAEHGQFDLILLTGDLAQDPSTESYRRIRQHLQAYATPCLCLPGNHDDLNLMLNSLNEGWIGCDKHRLLGDWSIVCLNSQKPQSPVGRLANEELEFLERTLQSDGERPTLIAMHHPCIASGSEWLDTMRIENSDVFIALLKRFPQVKAVICGHLHQPIDAKVDEVSMLVTPSTCFQFTPNTEEFSIDRCSPGYRLIELGEDGRIQSRCHRIPEPLTELNTSAHGY